MKFDLVIILGLVILTVCSARPAEDEYAEYDEAEPAPPPKKVPARTPLVGRRNPLAGKNNKATSTTTTTAAPEKEQEEAVAEGDYEDEAQPAETSSTTETPKKLIRSGIARPFRSNEDLLNSLKKRREQAASNKHSKPVKAADTEPAEEPVEKVTKETPKANRTSGGRRNRFSKDKQQETGEEPSSTTAAGRTGRRFNGRS